MIIINSKSYQLDRQDTLYAVLKDHDFDPEFVVVEVDKILVKRVDYKSFIIKDGMKIEVFSFIGGG